MMTPTAAILIVNHNSDARIEKRLARLDRRTRRNFEVIVVDNQSSGGSAEAPRRIGAMALARMLIWLPLKILRREAGLRAIAGAVNQ